MMSPASYFLAQRLAMHDKDVIYIANAAANQPASW
jgi:polysaccharide export outer membrane protein